MFCRIEIFSRGEKVKKRCEERIEVKVVVAMEKDEIDKDRVC